MAKHKSDDETSGADARTRLIEVAAKHFAEDGFKGSSQRAIQREAGVNPAAAHYYFGSKEAMYQAVIETFIHSIQEQRIKNHAAIPKNLNSHERLKKLLQGYFEPTITIAETPSGFAYARILARNLLEQKDIFNIFEEAARPVRELYLDSLGVLFPDIDRGKLTRLLLMGVSLMASISVGRSDAKFVPAEQAAEELSCFVAAGFAALLGLTANKITTLNEPLD